MNLSSLMPAAGLRLARPVRTRSTLALTAFSLLVMAGTAMAQTADPRGRTDPEQGRHGLDADLLGARADDVGARPRPVLRRPGPHQEHAVGADPGVHDRVAGGRRVGPLRLLAGLRRRRQLDALHRRLRQSLPGRGRAELQRSDLLERRRHPGICLHGVPDDLRDDHAGAHRRRLRGAHEVLGRGRCSCCSG